MTSFYEMLCREPPRHQVVFHYLVGDDAGLVPPDKNRGLPRGLAANEGEEIGPLRIGHNQAVAMPVQGHNFIKKVPGLKVPSRRAGVLADDPNRAGIIPTESHEHAALECYLVRSRLHVLSDRLHERALVGNSFIAIQSPSPKLSRPLPGDRLTPNTQKPYK